MSLVAQRQEQNPGAVVKEAAKTAKAQATAMPVSRQCMRYRYVFASHFPSSNLFVQLIYFSGISRILRLSYLQLPYRMVLAAVSGMGAATCCHPLDVIRVQMQTSEVGRFRNTADAAVQIYRNAGLKNGKSL